MWLATLRPTASHPERYSAYFPCYLYLASNGCIMKPISLDGSGSARMKTAATAVLNYGTNGGSTAAQTAWALNFSSNIDTILSAAIKAVPQWQAAVATAQAATNMTAGLTKAKGNEAAI